MWERSCASWSHDHAVAQENQFDLSTEHVLFWNASGTASTLPDLPKGSEEVRARSAQNQHLLALAKTMT